jgi:hypothetical protein
MDLMPPADPKSGGCRGSDRLPRHRRTAHRGATVLMALVATAGTAVAAAREPPPGDPTPLTLQISGQVDGLTPGIPTWLPVTVTNPAPFAVQLTRLEITVARADELCPAAVLDVGPAPTGSVIRARGETIVWVPVALSPTAPDDCQGATWPMRYDAEATRHK